ncbi:MAG: PD-(D/E)XK nuclease family protein [Desulfobacula sp.]|uniref:PD-(D/E)XK nuclease family protein n=1 Tax=Desulfobacula sp. TaxID=2593537 RepID=UPI0025BF43F4|nr:PD-(D/E)XK nuclease family protein [Desulfobacula sp.]MCD4719801.1 PD-(D/E)XK nuclease family protein [Desulfobacula sp.]
MNFNHSIFKQFIKSIPCPDDTIYSQAFSLDNKNLKFATPILSKFPHTSTKEIKWQDQDLSSIVNRININLKYSAKMISKNFCNLGTDICTEHLSTSTQYVGEISNPNHGLALVNKLYIPKLNERQVTEGIALCLNDSDKICTFKRVLTFLKALPVSKDFIKAFEGMTNREKSTIKVESEVVTKKNKRIDILIHWESANKPYGIAIEAKFDHKVTKGQLPPYKKYCIDNFEDRYKLILLTNQGDYNKINKDWKPLSWLSLLIRLEKGLKKWNCDDSRFSCFRSMLWKKIGGV